MGINQNVFIYLNEIEAEHDRINLVVMIMARLDIDTDVDGGGDDEMDFDEMESMEFYWVIWDGSIVRKIKI